MKKLLAMSVLIFFGLAAKAENRTVFFSVNPPLVCNNCETKMKENIRFEKGVKSVKPSAKKGTVEIVYDDSKTHISNLVAGFKKIGYEATEIDMTPLKDDVICNEEEICCGSTSSCCSIKQKE